MKPARRCTRAAVGCSELAERFHEQSPTFVPNPGSANDPDVGLEMIVSGVRL